MAVSCLKVLIYCWVLSEPVSSAQLERPQAQSRFSKGQYIYKFVRIQ